MKKLLLTLGFFVLALSAEQIYSAPRGACVTNINGHVVCPPPEGGCLIGMSGNIVCSPPFGGIMRDLYGQFFCGPGQCVMHPDGHVSCSSQLFGAATLDINGNAVCTGGCVPGSAEACYESP